MNNICMYNEEYEIFKKYYDKLQELTTEVMNDSRTINESTYVKLNKDFFTHISSAMSVCESVMSENIDLMEEEINRMKEDI